MKCCAWAATRMCRARPARSRRRPIRSRAARQQIRPRNRICRHRRRHLPRNRRNRTRAARRSSVPPPASTEPRCSAARPCREDRSGADLHDRAGARHDRRHAPLQAKTTSPVCRAWRLRAIRPRNTSLPRVMPRAASSRAIRSSPHNGLRKPPIRGWRRRSTAWARPMKKASVFRAISRFPRCGISVPPRPVISAPCTILRC